MPLSPTRLLFPLPSAFIVQMSTPMVCGQLVGPLKAIFVPSGDQAGALPTVSKSRGAFSGQPGTRSSEPRSAWPEPSAFIA